MGSVNKSVVVKKEGRPTKKTETVVKKLEDLFKVGGTVEQACAYAGITKPTYYEWLDKDEDFLTKMEAAKHYADIAAKNIVVEAITKKKNLSAAQWWLEHREFKNGSEIPVQQTQINNFNLQTPADKKNFNDEFKNFIDVFYENTT